MQASVPSVSCESSLYRSYYGAAIFLIIFAVCSLPILLVALLFYNRHKLHLPSCARRYGVVYDFYSPDGWQRYYWVRA